jgi:C-terminal processing protease CtpA/Prc
VIGERTGGGAHPVVFHQITENIVLKIPNRRSINPITKSNLEGIGVIPDVEIENEKAFDYAYRDSLTYVRDKYENKAKYQYLIDEVEQELSRLI